jgi:hypothetical protein
MSAIQLCYEVKVKFTLEKATKAQKGRRGIALLLLSNLNTRWWLVVHVTP